MKETTMENVGSVAIPQGMEFEQVDVQILKVEKPGDFFIGKYVESSKRPWKQIDKKTGEVTEKEITQLHFTNLEGKAPFIVFADAGLQNAMTSSNIKTGDVIRAIKGEKLDLGGGQSVNQWSLFKAKQPSH